MEDAKLIQFDLDSLDENQQQALENFNFEMIKLNDYEAWLACFLKSSSVIHELTDNGLDGLMNFHLSLFMSALIGSPDCDAKNTYINEAIQLLEISRPVKNGVN